MVLRPDTSKKVKASRDPDQQDLRHFLSLASQRSALTKAADEGEIPVHAITPVLHARYGDKLKSAVLRRFAGMVVSSILDEEGFIIAAKGIRLPKNPVFAVGSRYERAKGIELSDAQSLLMRFVGSLTGEEMRAVEVEIRKLRRSRIRP